MDAEYKAIRVFYTKLSRAKYISHLDITRCMQRAIKRGNIPAWYTQGFNPHIYLTFALPLSLGQESESESMDLRLVEDIPFEEIKNRFNSVLPPDLRVIAVTEQVNKPDKIVCCLYEAEITAADVNAQQLEKWFTEFWRQEAITVEKRTKRGMTAIDIKKEIEIVSAGIENGALKLSMKSAAGVEKNVNPALLTDSFISFCGFAGMNADIIRKAVYMKDGKIFI